MGSGQSFGLVLSGLDRRSNTGAIDLSTDWSVYVVNRAAALQLEAMGVRQFTLSPEDGLGNYRSLLAEFGSRAVVIVHQDTPLFLAESCLRQPDRRLSGQSQLLLREYGNDLQSRRARDRARLSLSHHRPQSGAVLPLDAAQGSGGGRGCVATGGLHLSEICNPSASPIRLARCEPARRSRGDMRRISIVGCNESHRGNPMATSTRTFNGDALSAPYNREILARQPLQPGCDVPGGIYGGMRIESVDPGTDPGRRTNRNAQTYQFRGEKCTAQKSWQASSRTWDARFLYFWSSVSADPLGPPLFGTNRAARTAGKLDGFLDGQIGIRLG